MRSRNSLMDVLLYRLSNTVTISFTIIFAAIEFFRIWTFCRLIFNWHLCKEIYAFIFVRASVVLVALQSDKRYRRKTCYSIAVADVSDAFVSRCRYADFRLIDFCNA